MPQNASFIFREATIDDFEQLHKVRMAVNENKLSDPARITKQDYIDMLTMKGKGWLCEADGEITGFAIVDIKLKNIWALFVSPEFEGKGIGKKLQELMLNWAFDKTDHLWLTTDPGTRAEKFYTNSGWRFTGIEANSEARFEMYAQHWKAYRKNLKNASV